MKRWMYLSFMVVLFAALANTVMQRGKLPSQRIAEKKETQQLTNITVDGDCESPAEITEGLKIVTAPAQLAIRGWLISSEQVNGFYVNTFALGYLTRFSLSIKELIAHPIFLKIRCLRI